MQKHLMQILVGIAIAVVTGTMAIVGSDHNTIIVHGERLEDVKALKAVVNDLRQSNTDIKISVSEIKGDVKSLDDKVKDIKAFLEKNALRYGRR